MRNPRSIAKEKNPADRFAKDGEFDAAAGVPTAEVKGKLRDPDYRTNPNNPPEKPAPAKGLHR